MPSVVLGGRRGGGSGLAIVVFIVASSAEFPAINIQSLFSLLVARLSPRVQWCCSGKMGGDSC